jgi:hypothetical protein
MKSKNMDSLEKIRLEFDRIKGLGYIKSNRINNKDGGIGNTFEDYLGVTENNLKDADFEGFEVKTQKQLTKSYITLFSKSPSYPRGANAILKDRFAEVRDGNLKLYASIFGNRWSSVYDKHLMTLNVDFSSESVVLNSKSGDNSFNDVYWSFVDLQLGLRKLNNLFVVSADQKIVDGIPYYHYNSGLVYLNVNFNKFLELLSGGFIQFDIRIGVHKSGKSIGKPHDHGSGFRIRKEILKDLYGDVIEL